MTNRVDAALETIRKHAAPDSQVGRFVRAFPASWGGSKDEPLAALTALAELLAEVEAQEDAMALAARMRGATWQGIADARGITRQRAHQRWGFADKNSAFRVESDTHA